ncbi:uncharacterized protein LOC143046131 isoform X2 [Mytilus galloprovincialis]
MQWDSDMDDIFVHDYHIGLSSTKNNPAPDILPFRSTKHHRHFRLNYPDLTEGTLFYIIIKSTSKANVDGIQSYGPVVIDVTAPVFTGSHINLELKDETLIANWTRTAFTDEEDPHPLTYQFALGHAASGTDVISYRPLQYNTKCIRAEPPDCTAIDTTSLDWSLHGHHNYYVTIKVTNLAGLSITKTSVVYTHDIQLPSAGIVYDINPNSGNDSSLKDLIDIDFSVKFDSLAAEWKGFYHPHLSLHYKVCVGTVKGNCDVTTKTNIDSSTHQHVFDNLLLKNFQKYYVTVEAVTKIGSIKESSDGITFINNATEISGVTINDGSLCSDPVVLNGSHHIRDISYRCETDIDYQTSTTSLSAKWEIPDDKLKQIVRNAYWSIEQRSPVGDMWIRYRDFSYIGSQSHVIVNELDLQPGLTYRFTIKLCADDVCFPKISSNGVTVIPSYPITGSIDVKIEIQKLIVTTAAMYDPDIEDRSEAIDAIGVYEWAINGGSYGDGLLEKWAEINTIRKINNTHVEFDITLFGEIDFSKCKRLYIRGANKAGVWSVVSTDLKQCHVVDSHSQIKARIVIDALGTADNNEDSIGGDVFLEENAAWITTDVDYTPFKNVLSAVWPSLRYKSYQWGVVEVNSNNAQTFYKEFTDVVITDPCSHPNTVICGQTDKNFANIHFNETEYLTHGRRYSVCIYAPETVIKHEKWTETLDTVTSCSDGVTVDLTPPVPGKVWIGPDPIVFYQTSSSDITVSWDSFIDVEEESHAMHSSGIKQYFISIGSVEGGVDIVDNHNVGLTNHMSFHNLQLQNGHKYFVTVKGIDFINRTAEVRSSPITVDTTPPEISGESIYISGRLISNLTVIQACWEDVFIDVQSGIDYYTWGVGSLSGQDDIIPFSEIRENCGVSAEDEHFDLTEGHPYFITISAFNRAHLSTVKSSWAYIYDMSPPTAGHVYDGSSNTTESPTKDIDYQRDMTHLSVYWEGFHDPHSVIKYFNVHIGTCPGCNDVMPEHTVGINTDFNVQNLNLQAGIKYFTTVTACNTGNLCTSVTTDGVIIDNSPPVQGVVQDGVYEHDIEYQSTRNYITAKWFGFVDSQSGIDHFVIRAGTSKGSSDVYPPTSLTSFDMVLLTALPNQLPLNHRIYISIRAYNKAGLYSESISNGFIVDISAPVIVEKPSLSGHLGTFFDGTTVLRSAFRFQWNVEDSQSDIQKQYISLSSHIYGQFNTSSITVAGIIREYTLTGLDFPDGGLYYIKLIVCNGAKICTESESDSIMVDTTPPTSGMFAVSTHHAANLQRHTIGSMSWSEYRINVALLGFNDLHSGIDKYYVSVGSEFMAFDLNKVPGSPMEFHHNDSGIRYLDEGPMQSFVVSTQLKKNYDHVFISVWAVNKVGLRSSMIHYKFQLIPGSYLDLIRRCTALTCLGHCICSPKYKRCHLNGDVCADVTTDNRNTLIAISDIIDLSDDTDVEFTPSNTFLSAKWKISKQQGLSPLWYEWSVGLTTQDLPEGVIDASKDPLWHHSGQNREATYSLKRGHELTELLTYSVFVRVWYSSNTYAIFKSNGVTVQAEEIHVNTQRGAAVVEKLPSFWKNDVDFILPGSLYTVVWKNVFMAKVGSVQKFNLYISTFKGGADLHKVNLDIDSSVNAVNISRLTMSPGIVYYSNVVAYTFSGLQTVVSSDGIMVDSNSPIFGIVYDGLGLNDIKYQNKSDIASASWHGFTDTESGIIKYTWCVGTNRNDKDCDIVPWKTIGMHTSVSTSLQNHLNNGQIIYSKVIATDGVGHTSDTTPSNGVTVDTTPPVPIMFSHAADNFITNPSFEETHGCFMDTDDISVNNLCDNDNCYQPLSWSKVGCLVTIKSDVDTAHDGRSFIYLKGTMQQNIQQLSSGNLYKLSFVTSHPHINTAVISNIEGSVKFGHKEYVFHIFTKENQSEIVWHLHTFYFTPNTNSSDLIISNLNRNIGFLVDNVKVQAVEVHPNSACETPVQVHTVGLHRWSSIHASWNFVDFGSPITEYLWAIGNTRGNAEMQHFQSVGVNNFGYNYNITLAHSSQVHVTVVAINAAGLQAKAYSAGVDIDNTPPVINQVHDGVGVDIDGQTSNIISANWDVIDPESDIDYCEWSIGLQPYGNELQPFTKTTDVKSASISFVEYIISQKTVYTTVRCHNKAGLYSTATSDGVTISDIPPSSDHAVITIIPQSLTEYSPGDYYQGDKTSVRIKWSGFADQFGIMSFVVQFDGESIHLKNSILDINKQVSYMVMTGLHLPDTSYTASIAAMNAMYIRSSKIYTNITVNTSTPTVVDGCKLSTVKKDDEIIINWSDCFINAGSLVYEVSVGTTQGGADVIQWQETKNTFINILLTEKLKSKSNLNLFFLVRAVDHNGAYSSISDDISV